MPQHTSTGIVVADAARARILFLEQPDSSVHRVFEAEGTGARRYAVANVVNEMAARGGFDRLVLVAKPRILGELRELLSDEATACIAQECGQDLTRFSDEMVLHVVAQDCPDVSMLDDVDDDDGDDDDDDAAVEGTGGSQFQGAS